MNAARAETRRCGDRELVAAPPLTLSRELTEAASRHARDMALHQFSEMGVAFGLAPLRKAEIYWTQVFGTQL